MKNTRVEAKYISRGKYEITVKSGLSMQVTKIFTEPSDKKAAKAILKVQEELKEEGYNVTFNELWKALILAAEKVGREFPVCMSFG